MKQCGKSTIALFNGLPENAFSKTGIANDKKDSVRALLYHLAGHELHHINLVKRNDIYNLVDIFKNMDAQILSREAKAPELLG